MCVISYMVLTVNEDIAFSITNYEYGSALVVDHLLECSFAWLQVANYRVSIYFSKLKLGILSY